MSAERILVVVGARPNFMKAAPLMEALRKAGGFETRLVHTGQHFDANMSKIFFEDLGMPKPDAFLDINQTSRTLQIARVMEALEKDFSQWKPDVVVVVGDVNSALAAGLVANHLSIPLAHVEAGLRSFDRSMPEEFNRLVVDQLADYLFTPSADGDENLKREGIPESRIYRVGNIMVDSLNRFRGKAESLKVWEKFKFKPRSYGLVTLHRPSNVDDPETFEEIFRALCEIQKEMPLLFPVHPRTRQRLESFGLLPAFQAASGLRLCEPMGYLDLLSLMTQAGLAITDSGGIQEETTVLGVPCLTVRQNTERPITISHGTNRLAGQSAKGILEAYRSVQGKKDFSPRIPELWDGRTAERIVEVLSRCARQV